jgi:UPF0271 protein
VTAEETHSIDLNADLGEHEGNGYAADFALLDVVTSANIACGGHAGSPDVMRLTVAAASGRGVSIGAHPGYPDREGFGRRELNLGIETILASVQAQIELLAECCAVEGARLRYVKPHGALYNRAVRDEELARLLAARIANVDRSLMILTLPGSALEREARSTGLTVAREAFIDRAYSSDGTLVPRDTPGAVIEDPGMAATRALEMARDHTVTTLGGVPIGISPDSLCVHGDSRHALETVRLARQKLEDAGFAVRAFAR